LPGKRGKRETGVEQNPEKGGVKMSKEKVKRNYWVEKELDNCYICGTWEIIAESARTAIELCPNITQEMITVGEWTEFDTGDVMLSLNNGHVTYLAHEIF